MPFGRLQHRSVSQPMSEINMTPLIDVMLVLLVIFIITAPLLASSIRLDLPHTSAARTEPAAVSVIVAVGPDGQVYWQDQPLSLPDLTRRLTLVRQGAPDTEVQLRADQRVPYGRIVEVMDAAQQAGLSRIGFVADPSRPEASGHKP